MKILLILSLIWIIPLVIIALHKVALKLIPYRWLVNSIIHPAHVVNLKRKLFMMTDDQVFSSSFKWYYNDKWFKRYWFGKHMQVLIDKEVLKRIHNKK